MPLSNSRATTSADPRASLLSVLLPPFVARDVSNMPSEKSIYLPDSALAKTAYISSFAQYKELYRQSIDNPEEFWGEIAKQFYWETPADINRFFVYNFDIGKGPIYTKWLDGATTNISYNLLDRNVKSGHGDKVAFYWSVNIDLAYCL